MLPVFLELPQMTQYCTILHYGDIKLTFYIFENFISLYCHNRFSLVPAGLNNMFSIILLHIMGLCFIFYYITMFMWFQISGY